MAELGATKSIFTSKTAITGLLLSLFGILNALGILPAGFDATTLVNGILVVGGVLVTIFRSIATQKVAVTPTA